MFPSALWPRQQPLETGEAMGLTLSRPGRVILKGVQLLFACRYLNATSFEACFCLVYYGYQVIQASAFHHDETQQSTAGLSGCKSEAALTLRLCKVHSPWWGKRSNHHPSCRASTRATPETEQRWMCRRRQHLQRQTTPPAAVAPGPGLEPPEPERHPRLNVCTDHFTAQGGLSFTYHPNSALRRDWHAQK